MTTSIQQLQKKNPHSHTVITHRICLLKTIFDRKQGFQIKTSSATLLQVVQSVLCRTSLFLR